MFKTTLIAGILASASICAVSAADLFVPKTTADFSKAGVTGKDGVYTSKGGFTLYSTKTFKMDPAKKYKISADFKSISGTPGYVYIGFKPLDAKNRWIQSSSVCCIPQTMTELAAPAKKGDKVVKVKNAANWKPQTGHSCIAFDARADFSDLPNFDFIYIPKNGVEKKGNVWEITLKTPLKKAYKAGTKVRQQTASSTFIYAALRKMAPKGEAKLSGIVSGLYKDTIGFRKFWNGTKSFQVIVLHGSTKNDAVLEFKNIKLEEVK